MANTNITVRDFDTNRHALTLPSSRLGSYDDLLQRTYVPLFKNPNLFNAHLHFAPGACGVRVQRQDWDAGRFFVGGNLTLYVHFDRIPGAIDTTPSIRKPTAKPSSSSGFPTTATPDRAPQRDTRLPAVPGVAPHQTLPQVPFNHDSRIAVTAPPPRSPHARPYFSSFVEFTPILRGRRRGQSSEVVEVARPWPGFDGPAVAEGGRRPTGPFYSGRTLSESPLFEPEDVVEERVVVGGEEEEELGFWE